MCYSWAKNRVLGSLKQVNEPQIEGEWKKVFHFRLLSDETTLLRRKILSGLSFHSTSHGNIKQMFWQVFLEEQKKRVNGKWSTSNSSRMSAGSTQFNINFTCNSIKVGKISYSLINRVRFQLIEFFLHFQWN